jgi:beta-lactamase regulating signal transducer with metallopeptidase domain
MDTLLLATLNSFWLVAAVAAAAYLAMKLVPRFSAATRYAVWWAVLGTTLVLPAALNPSPLLDRPRETLAAAQPETQVTLAVVASESEPQAIAPQTRAFLPLHLFPLHLPAGRWPLWVFAVWSAVFLFHIARLAWSYRFLSGIKRRAHKATAEQRLNFDEWLLTCRIHRPVRLLISDEIASPMAVGFRHPVVLLPESLMNDLSQAELDHVLLHELAHIARYDDWTNLLARVAIGALVLHPVAAWVLRRIEREREIACDDWVVAVSGAARPYAECLARLLELCTVRRQELLATGIAGRTSLTGERIERLIRYAGEVAPRVSARRIALTVAMLVGIVTAGAYSSSWVAFAEVGIPEEAVPVQTESPRAATPASAPTPVTTPAPNAKHARQATPTPTPEPSQPEPQPEPKRVGFLAALTAAGYTNLSVDEIIEMKSHGITAEYISQMNAAGLGKLTPKQLVQMASHGVRVSDVQEAKKYGLNITFEQLIRLKSAGVI